MFTKTLTAGVLATSLALTSFSPTTASAAMSEEDAFAGIIALLFLGAAIHNNRNDDVRAPVQAPVQHPRPQTNNNWRVLPSECLRVLNTRRGETVRLFGQRCLNNNYGSLRRLPQECHVRLRTPDGTRRQGFGARCLRQAGFRTDRR